MTWTTGPGNRSGAAGSREAGSWVKTYGGGHKTRAYASALDDPAGWGPPDAGTTSVGRTGSRRDRWLLAVGAVLALVAAVVLRTASDSSTASGAALAWGHLGLGLLCVLTLAGLVLAAVRR